MTDQPNSNVRQPTGWPRAATPCDLKPRWAGEFRDFSDWVSFASARLSGCEGSVGQEVPAICVDAKGRRCHVGKDFQRARDEDAFPVRYFWECDPADPQPPTPPSFQSEVDQWMDACFGDQIKADQLERGDRFIEEALELAQTMPGFGADRAHALVDYVFSRPVGDRFQEVGGVMVTLAALCNAAELDLRGAAALELARVWTKVEAIRAKQAAKPTGSALPVAVAPEAGATA